MSDCIFCRIAAGELAADVLYSDDQAVAFRDIQPQAPTHVLVIPRAHWRSLADVPAGQQTVLGHLLEVCRGLAARLGCDGGYRVVINTGPDGGQAVDHLHLHILGGRPMAWPPG